MTKRRCGWCGEDPLYVSYHDEEWGVPLHDDQRLFEMLVLEGMQSGLSWITILRKRNTFREAFANFDPNVVARFGQKKVTQLLNNPGIIRNRAKVEAAIANAQAALKVQKEFGSLDAFLWRVVDGKPIANRRASYKTAPARTALSEKLSKECRAHGFKFVGPTVAYAFMQAVGMVNDHEVKCFRYSELSK
jgi:DNA-3-methyladenine glycosylase I